MGSGASKKKKTQEEIAAENQQKSGAQGEKRDNDADVDRPDVELVVADATHPDWEQADVFVFSVPPDWEQQHKKQGRFYSRLYRFIGTWKVEQNVMTIRWDNTNKMDVIRADKSELVFDNPQTKLKIVVQEPNILPEWIMPECLSRRFERDDQSMKNFECGVCYFELWKCKCAAMRRYTRRVCEHYIHYECANFLLTQSKKEHGKADAECPVCGARFTEIKEVPDLMKDPRGWFQVVDADFGGSLSRTEVLNALGSVLPIERDKLVLAIEQHWHEWDPDQSGTITVKEFLEKGFFLLLVEACQSNVGFWLYNNQFMFDDMTFAS